MEMSDFAQLYRHRKCYRCGAVHYAVVVIFDIPGYANSVVWFFGRLFQVLRKGAWLLRWAETCIMHGVPMYSCYDHVQQYSMWQKQHQTSEDSAISMHFLWNDRERYSVIYNEIQTWHRFINIPLCYFIIQAIGLGLACSTVQIVSLLNTAPPVDVAPVGLWKSLSGAQPYNTNHAV